MRAIVVRIPNSRAQKRATASSEILLTLYDFAKGSMMSPSGSSSRNACQGSGCGL